MKILVLSLLFLTGCFVHHSSISEGVDSQPIVAVAPLTKQKQRVILLQKKLESAEKEEKKASEEVEKLQKEVREAQLALICRQIDSYEQQIRKLQNDPHRYVQLLQIESSTLFLKEREMLHQMIQTGPSPAAFEAQVVLDRILRVITELGDTAIR